MSQKLFVGGLSWDTDSEGLRRGFESFGDIEEAKVILDRDTGRSRGFGFVSFKNADDAKRAIAEMDGSTLDGRSIRVNEAAERPPRSGGGGGGGGGFGGGRDSGGPRGGGGGGGPRGGGRGGSRRGGGGGGGRGGDRGGDRW